jgi:hypothetical protein
MTRRCPFCSGTDLTHEHVWPQWLASLLPGEKGSLLQHIRGTEGQPETHRTWAVPKLDIEPRSFCKECNTGWMADLENEARPLLNKLILGEEVHLSPEDRTLAARWTMKTALTAEFSYGKGSRSIPARHYRSFFMDRLPPLGTHILLACLDPGSGILHRSHRVGPSPSRSGRTLTGYCSTSAIRHLAFQVLWVGGSEDAPTRLRTSVTPGTVGAWPRGHLPVRWPPRYLLDEDMLNELCETTSIG